MLSRSLIDEGRLTINLTNVNICYFFFKEGVEGRTHATQVLCAVLNQLFTQGASDRLIQNALSSHRKYGKALAQNVSVLWQILVLCASSMDLQDEKFCLLDALDESTSNSRRQIINQLRDLYLGGAPPNIKFLITSRP